MNSKIDIRFELEKTVGLSEEITMLPRGSEIFAKLYNFGLYS